MIEPTNKDEALAAVRSAEQRLVRVRADAVRNEVTVGIWRGILEENHFTSRVAGLFNLRDDRP